MACGFISLSPSIIPKPNRNKKLFTFFLKVFASLVALAVARPGCGGSGGCDGGASGELGAGHVSGSVGGVGITIDVNGAGASHGGSSNEQTSSSSTVYESSFNSGGGGGGSGSSTGQFGNAGGFSSGGQQHSAGNFASGGSGGQENVEITITKQGGGGGQQAGFVSGGGQQAGFASGGQQAGFASGGQSAGFVSGGQQQQPAGSSFSSQQTNVYRQQGGQQGGNVGFAAGSGTGSGSSSSQQSSGFSGGINVGSSNAGSSGGSVSLGQRGSFGSGQQYSSGSSSSSSQTYSEQVDQTPIVSKQFYVFGAPEEQEDNQAPRYVPIGRPQKNYKIIFIKTPQYGLNSQVIPVVQPNEEKTIVYVLSKKPSFNQDVQLPPVPVTEPSKPDVFFIKYNNEGEAVDAQQKIQGK